MFKKMTKTSKFDENISSTYLRSSVNSKSDKSKSSKLRDNIDKMLRAKDRDVLKANCSHTKEPEQY